MRLVRAQFLQLPTMGELAMSFLEPDGAPRMVTVIVGAGGVGKTTLLASITATRPGHACVQSGRDNPGRDVVGVCDWMLGDDDPQRPHPLRVVTPNTRLADGEAEDVRRREQAHFDRRAKEGGFAFLHVPGHRWFSRQPFALVAPERSVLRHEPRLATLGDDPSRADLTRETKQILSYVELAASVARDHADQRHFEQVRAAMRAAIDALAELVGYHYVGLDPASLEPMFQPSDVGLPPSELNGLPNRAKHLVGIVALAFRALWAAHPRGNPARVEAVVCVDDVEMHQDPAIHPRIVPALRRALPGVQWIVTTSSSAIGDGCEATEVFALRRQSGEPTVRLYDGAQARLQ